MNTFVTFFHFFSTWFKNVNKGTTVLKRAWFVRPGINTGMTIILAWNDKGT